MNWVKKYKLLAIKAIQFNGRPCIEIDNLWQTLHLSFNLAHDYQTDPQLLKEIPCKEITKWNSFLKKEFVSMIEKCNNLSTPRLDKLSWCYMPSPLIQKLHFCSDIAFQPYKPAFYGSHLSCNMSYGSNTTIGVFHLP